MIDYSRDNYSTTLPYIISKKIYEYDIEKANANILLYKNILSMEEYDRVIKLDRMNRQIYLGNLQKDKKVSEALKEGFTEFRRKFLESNNLDEIDIVSIKKDAIFTTKKVDYTKFDNITFRLNNIYTSYYKIASYEFYYLLDKVNDIEQLDIKGISDHKLSLHRDYMIEFLCILFEMLQSNSINDVLTYVIEFSKKYPSLELDIGYYREFSPDSLFRFCNGYTTDFIEEKEKRFLNVAYNYKFLVSIYELVSTIYFNYIH